VKPKEEMAEAAVSVQRSAGATGGRTPEAEVPPEEREREVRQKFQEAENVSRTLLQCMAETQRERKRKSSVRKTQERQRKEAEFLHPAVRECRCRDPNCSERLRRETKTSPEKERHESE